MSEFVLYLCKVMEEKNFITSFVPFLVPLDEIPIPNKFPVP